MRSARAQRRRRTSSSNSSSVYPKNPRSRERPWGSSRLVLLLGASALFSLFPFRLESQIARARPIILGPPRRRYTTYTRKMKLCRPGVYGSLRTAAREQKRSVARWLCVALFQEEREKEREKSVGRIFQDYEMASRVWSQREVAGFSFEESKYSGTKRSRLNLWKTLDV